MNLAPLGPNSVGAMFIVPAALIFIIALSGATIVFLVVREVARDK